MDIRVCSLFFQLYQLYPTVFGSIYTYNMPEGRSPTDHCTMSGTSLFCTSEIPAYIPDGVEKVYIQEYNKPIITSEMFQATNWKNVSSLTISSLSTRNVTAKAEAFRVLTNITELGLHGDNMLFETDTFKGIKDLKIFDISGCRSVTNDMLLHSLNGSERIQRIEDLNISQISTYIHTEQTIFNQEFSTVLGQKYISSIIAQGNTITFLNFTALEINLCNSLRYLDLSNTKVVKTTDFHGLCDSLKHLYLDSIGYINVLPYTLPENIHISRNFSEMNLLNLIFNVEVLYARRIFTVFPHIKNVTLTSLPEFTIRTKKFVLSKNGLQYIDLKILNVKFSIEYLDMSSNGMGFLQTQVSGKCWLKTIDLADNNFYKMAKYNSSLFRTLFKNCPLLENVNLSINILTDIPEDMFMYNKNLRVLDLSNNKLEQITVNLNHNHRLLKLNLSGNSITLLSVSSIDRLTPLTNQDRFIIDLTNNPITCNSCNSKEFISWMVKCRENVITDVCFGAHGPKQIDESTVEEINRICERKARIVMITTTTISIVFMVTLVSIFTVMSWRKRKKKHKHRHIIDQFRRGRDQFEFPIFLAYCGEDEVFVNTYLKTPLSEHLRDLIGVDRDLICTGDRHFKLGHTIAEQTARCYDRSSVVMLVVSRAFCASNHCTYEAHIAFTMRKPIILMFKELVIQEDMPDLLKVIFKQFTRLTWKKDGDEYVMPTTWQNVCQSILDLVTIDINTIRIEKDGYSNND